MIFRRQPTLSDWQRAQMRMINPPPPFRREVRQIAEFSCWFLIPAISVLRTHEWSFILVCLATSASIFSVLVIIGALMRWHDHRQSSRFFPNTGRK